MLKKAQKLRKRKEYRFLQENSAIFRGNSLLIQYSASKFSKYKVGITATKKYGIAVKRNQFKRRVKAAVHSIEDVPPLFFNIIANHRKNDIPFSAIIDDIKQFILHVNSSQRSSP
jgi:ribonuclease P protein component